MGAPLLPARSASEMGSIRGSSERPGDRKQTGAYYTGTDVAGYIARNTLIPFLLTAVERRDPSALAPDGPVWRLLCENPDRYIYPAVRKGVDLPLPPAVAAGLCDVSHREHWNRSAGDEHGLPTETWREHVARRDRCRRLRAMLSAGQVRTVSALVACNLDIVRLAQDAIERCEQPELLGAFYRALEAITVLDPTCGTGAFLLAALDVLAPLHEACLDRMQRFVDPVLSPLRDVLDRAHQHADRRAFVLRSILTRGLYGVDIRREAVEVCRQRLLATLHAEGEQPAGLASLPEIEAHVRAGNALVGFATSAEVEGGIRPGHDAATGASGGAHGPAADVLRAELDRRLASRYGIDTDGARDLETWRASHQPFHWPAEFPEVMRDGGFDVVLGNPPYLEYRSVRDLYRLPPGSYRCEPVGNLYAFCMERSAQLLKPAGWFGMIVPAGVLGLDEAAPLRNVLMEKYGESFYSTYAIRPAKLFAEVDQRLCICLGRAGVGPGSAVWTTRYHHWHPEERPTLFARLEYAAAPSRSRLGRIPQVGSALAAAVLDRLEATCDRTVATYYAGGRSGCRIYYHRSPRYWIRAMDFEPYFRSATRSRSVHHFRDLRFADASVARVVGAVLNSSLFFFWFLTMGNGRNLTAADVGQFPLGELPAWLLAELPRLFDRLMADYREHSFLRVRRDCRFQEFRPACSKPLLDEIDRALARHYGLTEEERDFVLNYEIKYRLSASTREACEAGRWR